MLTPYQFRFCRSEGSGANARSSTVDIGFLDFVRAYPLGQRCRINRDEANHLGDEDFSAVAIRQKSLDTMLTAEFAGVALRKGIRMRYISASAKGRAAHRNR